MALDPSLLSGAINGTGDSSQSIFRRRAAATPTPGAAPAPQGIASPAPAAISDNGQSAIVNAAGGNPAYDAQTADAAARQARTGGGTFDPAAPLPSVYNPTGPSALNPLAPTYQPPQGIASVGGGVAPTPIGRAAGLVSTAALGGAQPNNGITTLPTLTVNGGTNSNSDPGQTTAQSAFLANNGVPFNQQTATAIGGDGTGDDAAKVRRAAIQAGTAPGQNVRLGYDATSRIYGTSSKPGGPIDTFTGAGIADASHPTTRIDGAGAVAQGQVGLGLTPEAAGRSAQVSSAAPQGISSVGAQLDNARDAANSTQRDINSNISRASDPFDPIGRQITNLRTQLGQQSTRSGREAINSQINSLMSSLTGGAELAANAKQGVENEGVKSFTTLANTGITEGGATQRANITQGGETQRLLLGQNAPTPEVTTDGGYRVRTGTTTAPVTGIDGKPVDAPLGASLSEGGRALQGFANQIGQSIASGQMTPEQGNEALTQARVALTAPRTQGGVAAPPASSAQPPKEAAAFLRQNPSMKAQFDAKYGRGAADRILGGA